MYLVFVCHYFSCGLDGFSLFAIHDLGNLESYFVRSLKLSFAGACVSWLDWAHGFRGRRLQRRAVLPHEVMFVCHARYPPLVMLILFSWPRSCLAGFSKVNLHFCICGNKYSTLWKQVIRHCPHSGLRGY